MLRNPGPGEVKDTATAKPDADYADVTRIKSRLGNKGQLDCVFELL